jgi:hypothetical protein
MRKTIALALIGSLVFLNACPSTPAPTVPGPVTGPVGKLAWLGESFDVAFTISNWASRSKVGGVASTTVQLETDAPDLPIGAVAPATGQVLPNGTGTLKMTAATQTVAFAGNENFQACKDLLLSDPAMRSLSVLVVVPQEYVYDPNDASKLTYQRDQGRLEYRTSKDVFHEFYWASVDGTVTGSCVLGAATFKFSLVLKKGWNNVITDEANQTVVTGDRPAAPNGYSLVDSLAGRI